MLCLCRRLPTAVTVVAAATTIVLYSPPGGYRLQANSQPVGNAYPLLIVDLKYFFVVLARPSNQLWCVCNPVFHLLYLGGVVYRLALAYANTRVPAE